MQARKTSPADIHRFDIDSLMDLRLSADFLRQHIETHGYMVLSHPDTSAHFLTQVCAVFGVLQDQLWADNSGFVLVTAGAQKVYDDHATIQLSKNNPFDIHTDGSYMDGVARHRNAVIKIGPPNVMLLQCVKQAETGGTSLIVDVQKVLQAFAQDHPHLARILSNERAFSFRQDNRNAENFPLFESRSDGSLRLRYRKDLCRVEEVAMHAYDVFVNGYLENQNFWLSYKLCEGEILIADNFRVLHGRTAFEVSSASDRIMRRAWIFDPSHACPQDSSNDSENVYERFKPRIGLEPEEITQRPLQLGIRISLK